MQTRRILLGALSAPLLLLPACGGGDSVADPPVSSAPPSSDPTQPPKRESPEHFIRRFYRAEQRMENTGKTKRYALLFNDCRSCHALANQVLGFYAKGGYVRWGGLRIRSIEVNTSDGKQHAFAVRGVAAPTSYQSSSSGSTQHLEGGKTTELVTLEHAGRSWVVTSFAKLGE
jgi:hypothetical protein